MTVFVKFGGSVITDKTRDETPDPAMIAQLAAEVQRALQADPTLRLILSHGSGSFGHVYAQRYGIHQGLAPEANWMGYARTSAAALRLNRAVVDGLLRADVPALALQPSATLRTAHGGVTRWDTAALALALDRRLVPVVHGDVAFDEIQGCAIASTESLLVYLAQDPALRPARVVLVGEAGVYTADPRSTPHATRVPRVDPTNIATVLHGASGSHGADVTGGMRSKLELMWQLVQANPGMEVQLIGTLPGLLARALVGTAVGEGTVIVGST